MGRPGRRDRRRRARRRRPAPGVGGNHQLTRVLLVCTANRCRSPMAAAILHSLLAARQVPAGIASAGFLEEGHAAPEGVERALARRGLRPLVPESRRIDTSLVERADLILAMERAHAREVVLLVPEAWRRTFTLKELVRRAQATGPRTAGETFAGWLRRVHLGRAQQDLLGEAAEDDIADPFGGLEEDYEYTAEELEALLATVAGFAWPEPARVPTGGPRR